MSTPTTVREGEIPPKAVNTFTDSEDYQWAIDVFEAFREGKGWNQTKMSAFLFEDSGYSDTYAAKLYSMLSTDDTAESRSKKLALGPIMAFMEKTGTQPNTFFSHAPNFSKRFPSSLTGGDNSNVSQHSGSGHMVNLTGEASIGEVNITDPEALAAMKKMKSELEETKKIKDDFAERYARSQSQLERTLGLLEQQAKVIEALTAKQ